MLSRVMSSFPALHPLVSALDRDHVDAALAPGARAQNAVAGGGHACCSGPGQRLKLEAQGD